MTIKTVRNLIVTAAALGLAQGSLFAADGYWDRYQDRGRYEHSDVRRDYARVDRINDDIRRDQCRLDEAYARRDYRAAERIREDLRRDYAARDAQARDIRHDRDDLRRDRWYR